MSNVITLERKVKNLERNFIALQKAVDKLETPRQVPTILSAFALAIAGFTLVVTLVGR